VEIRVIRVHLQAVVAVLERGPLRRSGVALARLSQLEGVAPRKFLQTKSGIQKVCTKNALGF
jgi:hypothetical protein